MTNKISHRDFIIIVHEEKKYLKIKETIRMIKSQGGDIERNKLIDGKRMGSDNVITQIERINNNLKSQA